MSRALHFTFAMHSSVPARHAQQQDYLGVSYARVLLVRLGGKPPPRNP
jgi:hypothetical protein